MPDQGTSAPRGALESGTALELRAALDSGALSSRTLAEACLERVETLDRSGPRLNSIIELNPEALEIADALDAERRAGKTRGPLHGLPVLLKDNIDTHDRMATTAGSLALADSIAPRDAFLVERLRAAGAIILGKTNLSEWANFRSSHSVSGWSSRGGLTKNPHALDRNACGSSSGSAVAVAAGLCPLAVGTETDGSIICPSHINGIVGIKPTLGLVSRSGIIPIAHSQDTAGPMARDVAGAALLLGALAGIDGRDPATAAQAGRARADYTVFLDPEGLRGARIGVARDRFGDDARVAALMEGALAAMREKGAVIVEGANLEAENRLGDAELEVLLYEFKADLGVYLASRGPEVKVRSLRDVIEFNEAAKDTVMPFFGQERMLEAEKRGDLGSRKYLAARRRCLELSRRKGIDAVMRKHRLTALVFPSGNPAWTTDLVNGDHYRECGSSLPAVAGYPCVTVPAGFVRGLPVGLTFAAGAWEEPALIRLAYAFETATKARRTPSFAPTLAL